MAGLLFAEKIAGAADVEVMACQLKARPQRVEGLQHLEPPLGALRELAFRRDREQRIGARLRAPDAAAQLVKLGEAELVGAVHDERVGARDVETRFDDRGRNQHVIFAVVKGAHHVLELARRDLPMRHRDLELGHLLVEEGAHLRDVLDARADVEALATAIALAQKSFADGQGVKGRDEASHREAIDRRRRDDRELAHARERELQGARNGRRRERQHMHLGAQLLQPLLMRDAEMLLLVDDDEAQIA